MSVGSANDRLDPRFAYCQHEAMSTWLGLLVGGTVLLVGAELLVKGASRLAVSVGISPLVVGLTVVAFGTSAPEVAVTVGAAFSGEVDIALGNIIGSNISNVLLILGVAALVGPLLVQQRLVRFEVPLMIGVSLVCWWFAADGAVSRLEGAILTSGAVACTIFAIRQSRREPPEVDREYEEAFGAEPPRRTWTADALLVLLGLGMLVLGSRWLVSSAVGLAESFGVSQLVIGLTVVAVGTSLPELATSIMASLRGERDIAVGNVVGSNLFNLLGVLGLGALVAPDGIPVSSTAIVFDIPVMIVAAIACLPVFFTGYCISRWEGGLFLGYYAAYTLFLLLASSQHAVLTTLGPALGYFALPLTAITLGILSFRQMKARTDSGRNSSE